MCAGDPLTLGPTRSGEAPLESYLKLERLPNKPLMDSKSQMLKLLPKLYDLLSSTRTAEANANRAQKEMGQFKMSKTKSPLL